jgi:hypothetical protein
MQLPDFVKVAHKTEYFYEYSVCTLVTRPEEYLEMLSSFTNAGFTTDVCEFIVVDNTVANAMDAYKALNHFLQTANGKHIVICHQDILLTQTSSKALLDEQIFKMDQLDGNWAVLGNAGAVNRLTRRDVIKIAYQQGQVVTKGQVPQQVCSIDENFMIVKNSANLAVSANLTGFHLYGLDICLIAQLLGYHCYVIDFLLVHKSRGKADASFYELKAAIRHKYAEFMRGRYINTTITSFYLSGSKLRSFIFETKLLRRVTKILERI